MKQCTIIRNLHKSVVLYLVCDRQHWNNIHWLNHLKLMQSIKCLPWNTLLLVSCLRGNQKHPSPCCFMALLNSPPTSQHHIKGQKWRNCTLAASFFICQERCKSLSSAFSVIFSYPPTWSTERPDGQTANHQPGKQQGRRCQFCPALRHLRDYLGLFVVSISIFLFPFSWKAVHCISPYFSSCPLSNLCFPVWMKKQKNL